MLPLEGKSVLVLCQKLYNYDQIIVKELESQGAEVFFFENKFFREDPVLYKDIYGFLRRMVNPRYKDNYLGGVLNDLCGKKIDFLLCIGGFSITETFLLQLKHVNPLIRTVLYLWDSIAVWDYSHHFKLFDAVYTFDRNDSLNFSISYHPLFYTQRAGFIPNEIVERKIDVTYVASVGVQSQERLELAKMLKSTCKLLNLQYFIYIYYNKVKVSSLINFLKFVVRIRNQAYTRFQRLLKNADPEILNHTSLSSDLYLKHLYNSKCVVDFPVKGQVGLTMRTIESLAAGCKLITTNKFIELEPFFQEEWIVVIKNDEDLKDLDPEFLTSQPEDRLNLLPYRLDNWLVRLLLNV